MRLSNKVLITLGIVWGAFLSISYLAAEHFLLESFLRLEESQIDTNINRVKQAIDQVSYALGTFTTDWAHWNDAYEYINGTNPQFVPNNLDFATLVNSNIDLLIYLNKQGDICVGVPFDAEARKQTAFPKGLEKYIYAGSLLENQPTTKSSLRGFALLPSGIMLIASAGTSYTDLSKPVNGTLIAGRYLSKKLLQKIADATSLSLTLYTPENMPAKSKTLKAYKKALRDPNTRYISIENDQLAYAYTVIYDIFKEPIGMLRLSLPRVLYATGKQAINFYMGVFFLSGLILSVVIWFLLRILVLKRLEYLNQQIKEIGGKKDYSRHIMMKEKDELASVAKQFNELMDTINLSHEQLKRQVREITSSEKKLEAMNTKLVLEISERKQMQQNVEALHKKLILAARRAGMADIASGVLHNVGNVLNNVTTSIGITKEMVENSRAKNLNDLANLLEQNKADLVAFLTKDQRGIKILDYISMLAKSLLEENKHMDEEIANLDKYINHIKDVISMQQSMSSVIGMNEQIKIRDVIDDALMLNKAISENKNIQFECDVEFNEYVHLDRVKLLHVVVNLIKNGIESLLESTTPDKRLSIRVAKKDPSYFTIEITDNGLGISPDHLTKIFNYGFTTKPHGNGIGLHTSATFVQEMGGKLYAHSEGIGFGMTFVVELPIQPLKKKA